jgi:presenilin 1
MGDDISEEDPIESIKYYVQQLKIIMQPVLITILLSMLWVKLRYPPSKSFRTGLVTVSTPSIGASFGTSNEDDNKMSLIIAGIIMGQIVVSTCIMACLMHFGKIQVVIFVT